MKCPLLTATSERLTGTTEYPPLDCLKEECAWWDSEHEMCRHCSISEELGAIQWELQELRRLLGRKANGKNER